MDRSTTTDRRTGRSTVTNGLRTAATALKTIGRAIRGRLPTAGGGQALPAFLVVLVVFWPVAGAAGGVAVPTRERGPSNAADGPVVAHVGSVPSLGVAGLDSADGSTVPPLEAASTARIAANDTATRKPYFEYSASGTTVSFDGTPIVSRQIEPDLSAEITNVTYEWEFGDGTTATGPKPTHTYDSGGFYDVTVTVFASTDGSESASVSGDKEIVVGPGAAFTVTPDRPTIGETVRFDATATPVPDNATNVSYRWVTSELSGPAPTYNTSKLLASPFFNRSDLPLSIPFRLAVDVTTDSGTTTYVRKKSVTVYSGNGSSESGFVADLRSIAYGETKRGFVNRSDPRNDSFLGGHHYEPVTFEGRKGDVVKVGMDPNATGRFPSVRLRGSSGFLDRTGTGQFVLPADGQYTIHAGFVGTAPGNYTLSLERVSGERPVVTVDAAGDVAVDESVTVTASAAADVAIDSYEWEFGDGTTATGKTVTHTFSETGDYTVEVVATDADGDTGTALTTVRVQSATVSRYDAEGDGMDSEDLQAAFEDVDGTGTGGDGETGDGTGTGDSDDGSPSLEQVRQLIENHTEDQGLVPTATDGTGGTDETDGSSNGDGSSDGDGEKSTDSDGDGFSDQLEKDGIPVLKSEVTDDSELAPAKDSDHERIVRLDTDPNKADTDGDGLSDGEELGAKQHLVVVTSGNFQETRHEHYALDTDPTSPTSTDSDGDGLPDGLEKDGIPVLKSEVTDDSKLAPAKDGDHEKIVRLDTDHTDPDTDDDGTTDGAELGPAETLFVETSGTFRETSHEFYPLNSDPTIPASADTDDDGLPNKLEQRGIPILAQTNAYRLSKAGEDADVTRREGDSSLILRLETDWKNADTDGDGTDDGSELANSFTFSDLKKGESIEGLTPGERAAVAKALGKAIVSDDPVDMDQTVYLLGSDPTDPNTDDTGIDDTEERKKGSDPTRPESFSVSVVYPVLGQPNCNVGVGSKIADVGNINNCAKQVDENSGPVYEINTIDEDGGGKLPKWLVDIEDHKISNSSTYYLVKVQVLASSTVSPATRGDLPLTIESIEFSSANVVGMGLSKSKVDDASNESPDVFGDTSNTKTVYLVVTDATRDDDLTQTRRLLGRAQMTLVVRDGPFARGSVGGDGTKRVTIESDAQFAVKDTVPETSPGEARAMVKRAVKKWAQNTVSAVVPVNGGALSATTFSVLSRGGLAAGAMLVNEAVALFTGIGKVKPVYVDDMWGKSVAGQGSVPAYLAPSEENRATSNIAITLYRAN